MPFDAYDGDFDLDLPNDDCGHQQEYSCQDDDPDWGVLNGAPAEMLEPPDLDWSESLPGPCSRDWVDPKTEEDDE